MSIRLMSEVWSRYDGSGNELLLALAIADFADDTGRSIYPSVATLAKKTRQSERTVQRQLRTMEDRGWISVIGNENGGRNNTRLYQIAPAWIKGDILTPPPERVTSATERVTNEAEKGDTAMSPDTSRTISKKQPSVSADENVVVIVEPDIDKKILATWKKIRKDKKLGPVTDIAWEAVVREAALCGLTPEQAVKYACESSWGGFKASWYKKATGTPNQPEQPKPAAQVMVPPAVQKQRDREYWARKMAELKEGVKAREAA